MRVPPVKHVLLSTCILLCVACTEDSFKKGIETEEIPAAQTDLKTYENWIANYKTDELDKVIEEELDNNSIIKSSTTETVNKRTREKVYVHYMPWFQSKEINGFWGQHWTMTNQNPEMLDKDGKRQIASHYYPLIGPYSTIDRDLQQYHLLLMKLSGVDGVIFDWYGIRNVRDFNLIKEGMESFLKELDKTKLEFAVMYEDRVVNEQARILTPIQVAQAKNDLNYIKQNYFSKKNYIKINNKELLFIFGPNFIDDSNDWTDILSSLKKEYNILSLWGAKNIIGTENSKGEFAWIDEKHLETLEGYYNYNADFENDVIGGVSYPNFNDFYKEGGWRPANESEWILDGTNEDMFVDSYLESLKHPVDFIQIATWNDFGEGTMIEPTEEFGYKYLEQLQKLTQVSYKNEDLKLAYYIYKLKKKFAKNKRMLRIINRAYRYAMKGRLFRSKLIVGAILWFYGDNL
ncbi:glycoside hydrolase family 71/99-like protein [Tenacibaculum amylolyticum]|uniref:glycoside hydrolase family 71/99-like protein n=1 Tax=Tenacibaculum amylolyticum TaxID=104269 RepID=UPI0038932043